MRTPQSSWQHKQTPKPIASRLAEGRRQRAALSPRRLARLRAVSCLWVNDGF
jgi:hypothetical protein